MRRLLTAGMLAAAFALPGRADTPVVVELYTSQGCSACPPADALLTRVAQRDDVIALSLHVDYWDYIGWTDSFAKPGFTQRQKAYARAMGKRAIYTPQMIVDGRQRIVGPKAMELAEAIEDGAEAPSPVAVEARRTGGTVTISLRPKGPVPGEMVVQVVQYRPGKTVDIETGENAGRTLRYVNVVTRWETAGHWQGNSPTTLTHAIDPDARAAVLVQVAGHGPILAAARAR